MGLYLGGLIIGRIFASDVCGGGGGLIFGRAYYNFFLSVFFWGGEGGGLIIGILQYFTLAVWIFWKEFEYLYSVNCIQQLLINLSLVPFLFVCFYLIA